MGDCLSEITCGRGSRGSTVVREKGEEKEQEEVKEEEERGLKEQGK